MAFRSSAVTVQGASISADLVATMPSGVASGDQLLALTAWDGFNTTVTPPSGWTQLELHNLSSPDGQTIYLWTKIATGSEGATQTWNGQTKGVIGIIGAWSGRTSSALTSAEVSKTNSTASNASPISVSLTGITASANDDIAVFVATDSVATSQWSYSQITNYTNQATGNSTDWASGNLQYRDAVSAGATGSLATTVTRSSGSGNAGWGGFVVRIAVGGGSTTTKVMSEALTLVDATVRYAFRARQMSDAITAVDEVVNWRRLPRIASEALVTIDAFVKNVILGAGIFTKVMSDTLLATDGFVDWLRRVRGPIDTVTLDDSDLYRTSIITANESIDLSDGFVSWRRLRRIAQDNIDLIDGFSKTLAGAGIVYAKVMSDTVTLIDDAGQRWRLRTSRMSEAIGLTDQVLDVLRLVRSLGDVVEFSDGTVKVRRSIKTAEDSLEITDGTTSTLVRDQVSNVTFAFGSSGPPFRFGGI